VKDQSYFLCGLTQQQLQRCLFPIGHLQKPHVRALAEKYNLPTKSRRDSQGICFLGKLKFDDFIEHYLGRSPGPVRCMRTGELLGTHHGLWFHTIGQRKGLGPLLNPGTVHAGPWFVCAKDVQRNTLFVSNETPTALPIEETHERAQGIMIEQVNWINGIPVALLKERTAVSPGAGYSTGLPMRFKLRHSPHFAAGTLHLVDSDQGDEQRDIFAKEHNQSQSQHTAVRVVLFEEPASVAPGQFVAFYQNDVCVGSGVVADVPIAPHVAQLVDTAVARESRAAAAMAGRARRQARREGKTTTPTTGVLLPGRDDMVPELM
jgi:tRNA-specific 2-thiouridylase